jgi:CBS domain containing-hemolysin-like protein
VNWLLVAVAALLIFLNAFFVVAEYALVRSRHQRLELAAEEGRRGAKLALRQLENINEYISTCQVGNTGRSARRGSRTCSTTRWARSSRMDWRSCSAR